MSSDHTALDQSRVVVQTEKASTALVDNGGLVDAYGGDKDSPDLRDLEKADRDFHAAMDELRRDSEGGRQTRPPA